MKEKGEGVFGDWWLFGGRWWCATAMVEKKRRKVCWCGVFQVRGRRSGGGDWWLVVVGTVPLLRLVSGKVVAGEEEKEKVEQFLRLLMAEKERKRVTGGGFGRKRCRRVAEPSMRDLGRSIWSEKMVRSGAEGGDGEGERKRGR
ncbi:hypothetical protein HAX54_014882 [Datura stramonium]|uniref:Uncharacterized protein n=1 Tax=Datura stramonium TaxID=4076 RepID=A0ABS8Y544_DATST|nr:hypothetical protein [Datura stramonium]